MLATLGALAMLGAPACTHEVDRDSTTYTTGAAISRGDAVLALAKARCQRDAECNNLRTDAFTSSRQDCVRLVRDDEERDLSEVPCRAGINRAQADNCIEMLQAEECSTHMGRIEAILECRSAQLCAR
jgi:hypothetical protein